MKELYRKQNTDKNNLKERQLEMATQALAKILVSQINAKYFEKNKNKKKSKKVISL